MKTISALALTFALGIALAWLESTQIQPVSDVESLNGQSNQELVRTNIGVLRSQSRLLGTAVSHAYVQNLDDTAHTNVRIKLVFTLSNGQTAVRNFYFGTLSPGELSDRKFGWFVRGAECVDLFYSCDQGRKSGTLDLVDGKWEPIEERRP